jgi:hypothetical protein
LRTYISEPRRRQQQWEGQEAERDAVYLNRRRKNGARGQRLRKKRGELIERTFAHAFETGGMRRTYLRKHGNIAKRLLVHLAGFNLGLLMRKLFGVGKPRCLQGLRAALGALMALFAVLLDRFLWPRPQRHGQSWTPTSSHVPQWSRTSLPVGAGFPVTYATGC